MAQRSVLITGGAGFIGSHLAAELLRSGARVRILDSLDPQVHHPDRRRPAYLAPEAEVTVGDVRDMGTVRRALAGMDSVCHMASAVGVGQSMYEIERYTSVNDLGTAVLLEAMIESDVERLLVASSMSIYGEGLARGAGGPVDPPERTTAQLKAGQWELRSGGEVLEPLPTPESKSPTLSSIYALNKFTQERMALIFGRAYGRKVTALRFFNVYGPDQALSNPYTGVLAIFGARLLNGRPPMVFEDGLQRRDFVHVRDVARACRLALESDAAAGQVINIGSGEGRTIAEVARLLAAATGRDDLVPHCTGKYRSGDIRHCFADISFARRLIGFAPQVRFEDGLAELAEWLATQVAIDRVDDATAELAKRGLVA